MAQMFCFGPSVEPKWPHIQEAKTALWGQNGLNNNFRMCKEEVTESSKSLQEIFADINTKINSTAISNFNISRSRLWVRAVRGLNRKQFSPGNKVSVKFTDDVGNTEGVVESGWPIRIFYCYIRMDINLSIVLW